MRSASEFRWDPIFQASFHTRVTLRASYYAPPDTGVPNLQLVALEYLLKIEGADQICWSAPFCGEVIFICSALCRGGAEPRPYRMHPKRLPFQGRLSTCACTKAPLCKGSWREAPEGLLLQICMKNPNRKFSLRFGKEETSTEDKKPCLQGFVPSWSFLTCPRRPYLFPRAGKDMEEKGAWGCVWCILPLNLGKHQCFGRRSTRWSPHGCLGTRRLIRDSKFVSSCG